MSMPAPSPVQASQPRYRLLRRWSAVAFALCVWNVGLWSLWNFEADRRLRAFIAERRALGEPVLPEDFAVDPVPDDQNAGAALVRIGAAIEADEYAKQFVESGASDEPFPDCDDEGRPNLGPIVPYFRQITAALRMPGLDYGARYAQGSNPSGGRKTFSVVRTVIKLLTATRKAHELRGDQLAAWASAEAALGVAARSTCPPHGTIALLLLNGYYRLALNSVDALSETGGIRSLEERDAVERTLAALTEAEHPMPNIATTAWWGSRFEEVDSVSNGTHRAVITRYKLITEDWFGQPPWWLVQSAPLAAPLIKLDALRLSRELTSYAEFASRGDWLTRSTMEPPNSVSLLQTIQQQFFYSSHFTRVQDDSCRTMTRLRISSAILASRLFEFDHGCLPIRLDDLVPAYLDAVPVDPFSPAGATLQYQREADPPRIFSVGADGNFNGWPRRRLTQAALERTYRDNDWIGLLQPQPERR